jgi:hypothetical protein
MFMSGFKPVGAELLYAYYGAGTVSVPTASPGSSMTLNMPPIKVPGGYFDKTGDWSSSLKMLAGGLFIATATLPTIQFALWRTVAQPATYANSGSAVLVGQTALFVASAVTTGCSFEMEWNLGLRTPALVNGGSSATAVVTCFGNVQAFLGSSATAIDIWPCPGPSATYTPTDTSWPVDQQVYLWPTILVTGATAGNTVTMEWCKLYGEN